MNCSNSLNFPILKFDILDKLNKQLEFYQKHLSLSLNLVVNRTKN